MLDNDVTELDQPFIYELDVFGVHVAQKLDEHTSDLVVSEMNKESYVSKLCIAKSYTEVEQQIQSFKKGLYEVIPANSLRIFSPGELAILISGRSEIDVNDLCTNARYSGYAKDEQIVIWFWEIVQDMSQSLRASLLFFITGTLASTISFAKPHCTGTLKAPFGGFKATPIAIQKVTDTANLPISHTWYHRIFLYLY